MSDPLPYDPDARRDTPLADALKARIHRDGPLSVSAYMTACLQDPTHGYYRTRAAIGRAGDFITAPEISQVFGELIGLWCVAIWQQMGAPASVTLVEVGPGRGTLMKDLLRAVRLVPAFQCAVRVVCVETNPVLAAQQRTTLAGTGHDVSWLVDLSAVPQSDATILVANEVLDTFAIDQACFDDGEWRDRVVNLDDADRLIFSTRPLPPQGQATPSPLVGEGTMNFADCAGIDVRNGAIFETTPDLAPFFHAPLFRSTNLAALLLDYGHTRSSLGDTLQAVRNHRYEHPLCSPGEADLSAQVDFEAVAHAATRTGLAVDGPTTQAAFLGSLGIMERASRLIAANPAQANTIEMAIARLMHPQGMGTRFQALGVRSARLHPLPGLPGN